MKRHQDTLSVIRGLAIAFVLLAGLGCKDDERETIILELAPQLTEDNVLNNLQVAWRARDIDRYAAILADDFRFYPDPFTRQELGVESWDRHTELAYVGCLFNSSIVPNITIDLNWRSRSATAAGFVGPRASWTRLFLTDVFVDVDFKPPGEEVTTYRVEDHTQRFYFRKGRSFPPASPGDTLIYLVEWRDDGGGDREGVVVPGGAAVIVEFTEDAGGDVRITRSAAVTLVLGLLTVTPGHGSEPAKGEPHYLPQVSEDNVLQNFITAYGQRDIDQYVKVLADDFHCVLPGGSPESPGDSWGRSTDSLNVATMFAKATDIEISMEWERDSAEPDPVAAPGQAWTRIETTKYRLEVFLPGEDGRSTQSFKAENSGQTWFFRKGRAWPPVDPADTLLYIVELRDHE